MNKKHITILSTALIVILLDQITKLLIKTNFKLNQSLPIIENILHLTYVTNTGSAFGLFKGFNLFFVIFSIIVIIAIFYFINKIKNNEKLIQYSVGLLLAGTIGNLIDRILHGSVIDFIDFRIWPVFNIADSSITIGVILLIILLWEK
ncbi:signal peptidase II [Candidatus Woesearchaeota archaeon]|jgi:signal peptidase II|nr:signal peptidase II [Candidatus Woesearchaeota archaeon]|tara:strand:+ start:48245 stop:48688 length:444 start_codon:yes stop_codon:yes gene_type:complete